MNLKPLVLTLLFCACASTPKVPPPPSIAATVPPPTEHQRAYAEVTAQATFAAMGDILMHEAVKQSAIAANRKNDQGTINNDGFNALFEFIAPFIRDADYAFANLETPVAPTSGRGTRSKVFNVSTSLLPALDQAGFDMVSFANNHVYDQGRAGFKESLSNLTASDLAHIGAGSTCEEARSPRMVDINTIQVAFIGATLIFNSDQNRGEDEPCTNFLDAEQAIASAKAAKEGGAELVVLSVHWGQEYRTRPQREHVEMAHQLMEGGVDVILGHHPHVLQPIEVYETQDHRTAVTIYSLGNAISNQSAWYRYNVHADAHGNPRDGVILLLDFVRIAYGKTPNGKKQVRTELANIRALPIWTLNETKDDSGSETPYIRPALLHALRSRDEKKLGITTDDDEALKLKKNIELYNDRMIQIDRLLGPGFLAAPNGK